MELRARADDGPFAIRAPDASQAQLRSEIGTLKTDLDQAQTERQHKMEYDAIALKIKAVGSRSDLET